MQLRVQFTSTQVGTEDTDEKCKKTCANMLVYPPGHAYANTKTIKTETKVEKPLKELGFELTHQYMNQTEFCQVFSFPVSSTPLCQNRFTLMLLRESYETDWH